LLVVEHLTLTSTGTSGIRFIFDADPVTPDVRLVMQADEVTELLWLPPDEAIKQHVPRGRDRLAAALAAVSNGGTTYIDSFNRLS
jgi:hypothetical protein